MEVPALLRDARARAGLTQRALAERAGTSQSTIAAYEAGRKDPTATTLLRVLLACGQRVELRAVVPVRSPSQRRLDDVGRRLADVLTLADALPSRPSPTLRFPRLPTS